MSWPIDALPEQRKRRGRDREVGEQIQVRKVVETAIQKVSRRTGIPEHILHNDLSLSSNPDIIFSFPLQRSPSKNSDAIFNRRGQNLFDILPQEVTDICLRVHPMFHELLFLPRVFDDPSHTPQFRGGMEHIRPYVSDDTVRPSKIVGEGADGSACSPKDSIFSRIPSTSSCSSYFPYGSSSGPDIEVKEMSAIGSDYPYQSSSSGSSLSDSVSSDGFSAISSTSQPGFIPVKLEDSPLWQEEIINGSLLEDTWTVITKCSSPPIPRGRVSSIFVGALMVARGALSHIPVPSLYLPQEEIRRIEDTREIRIPHDSTPVEFELVPIPPSSTTPSSPPHLNPYHIPIPPRRQFEPLLPSQPSPPRVPFTREITSSSPNARLRVHSDPLFFRRLAANNSTKDWFYNRGGAVMMKRSNVRLHAITRLMSDEERVKRKILAPPVFKFLNYGHGSAKLVEVEEDKVLGVSWDGRERSSLSPVRGKTS